jgi:16S rRNA (guanine527-N7)-methyltransferase
MPQPELAALQQRAAGIGVALDDLRGKRLLAYLDLLERWNRTYNLTAVRERDAMREQHLLDCLAVVPPLRRRLTRSGRVLDVGSGGGLPGVVIAVMADDIDVCCVDAVGKKAAFVRQVAGALSLPNLHAEHSRIENLRAGPFDVITSRAFASLPAFTSLTRQHLAEGGAWMAMKGQRPDAELAELPPTVEVFHVEPLLGLSGERCLVWMQPNLRYAPASAAVPA